MNEAAKEARRAYKRAWNKAHPDKVRKYQADYWTRKAEQAAAAAKDLTACGQEDAEQEAQA